MIQKQHFKNRTLAAVLLLLMAMLPQLASAYDFIVNGLCYNYNSDGTSVTVTSGGNYTGAVNIPSTVTYNGTTYSVTSIGDYAFQGCTGLTSVTIPNSVTSIGDYAFFELSGLTSVSIGNSVTSIGENAFCLCSGLTSVTIGNSVTSIGAGAFFRCSGLTSITIPNSVTEIGGGAFSQCSGLTSVTIGNSVTSIGSYAFYDCSGLTSVTIGNSVTSIGDYAFSGSTSLANIYCEILAPLSINENVFSNYNANLYVLPSSVSAYQSTYPWNKFYVLAIPATGITLSESSHTLKYNGNDTFSFQLTATITPSNASTNVSWTSSNANVARVSSNGTVTSAGRGTATITATTTDGSNLSASCVVTVLQLATSITLDQQAKTLNVGETFTLVPTILPSNANNKSVTWTSSNSTVASVNSQGKVTALKPGTATIKATTKDGSNLSASCVVTVVQPVNSISLSQTSATIYQNEILTLSATVLPTNASNATLSWSSSDTNVATVDQNGKVTGERGGTATITATTTDGTNLSASCVVTVIGIYDFKVNGLCYTINSDGTSVTVTYENNSNPSYSNLSGAKNIPSSVTYGGKSYSVTAIGDRAFYGCSGLTSITIQNSVTAIGDSTFYNCSGLTSVTIPNSVLSIGLSAFEGCSGLTKVNISKIAAWCNIAFSNAYGNPLSFAHNLYLNGTKVTNLVIPNSVEVIKFAAFYGCSSLTSVTIPSSVKQIRKSAFCYCSGLTSVTIPNSVTSIGDYIFYQCTGLTSVTIGNSVTEIGNCAFEGCSGLTSVTVPNSVTSIGWSAFNGCSGLTSVTIGTSVTEIGGGAFTGCSSLTTVNWNAVDCAGVEYDGFFDGLLNINTINFGSTVTKIPDFMCFNLGGLTGELTIPNSVTSIGKSAFYECTGLTGELTIPNSVTSIGAQAFAYCEGLTSVTIPNSVTSIRGSTFFGCIGLTSVTIPTSVTEIGEWAFGACTRLTSVTIPNSVTSIGDGAFMSCRGLTSVTIPNSVTTIPYSCFSSCRGLTSVTIPNSVTSIGGWAFSGCRGLTSVTIPNSVTSIGDGAFEECTGLTSVTIPNSVTTIGGYAFRWCSGLTNIYSRILHPENVTLGNDVFDGVDKSNCILTIPGGTLSLYQNANQWNEFLNMVVYRLSVAPDVAHVRGAEHRVHELSIDMSNEEAISGVQFLMTLPPGVSLATDIYGYYDVWLDDARRARNHSVSVEPRSGNKYFVLISSPTNKTFSGNTGDILHMNIEVDQYHSATGDYPVTISDIILAEADETEHNVSAAQSTVRMSYLVGDANADVEVDVGDYVVTANYILGHDTGIHFFSDAANANYTNNTAINVTDLVAITNIALELRDKEIKPDVSGFQRAPALTMPGTDYYLSADVIETGIDKTVIAVAVDNDEPIAAMQLDIDLPDGVTLESASVADRASGMNASCGTSPDGKARVVLSSFGTAEIAEGGGDVIMLTLRGKAQRGDLLQFSNVIMPEQSLIEHGAVGDLTLDLNDFTGVNGVTYENVSIYGSDGSVIIESPVEGMARLVRINGMSREVKVEPGRNVYPVNVSHGDIIIATFNGVTKKIQF